MSLLPNKFYLDDFFDDFYTMPKFPKNELMKTDIYEKGDNIHIEMDIPGYDKEDIKIDVENGILTIEATKEETKEEKDGKNYYRKERSYGSFKKQFNIGNTKDSEVKAKFNNGVLKISFPKEEKKETKKFIEIN